PVLQVTNGNGSATLSLTSALSGANEVQQITLGNSGAARGTFTPTFGGVAGIPIAVQNAVEGLNPVGVGTGARLTYAAVTGATGSSTLSFAHEVQTLTLTANGVTTMSLNGNLGTVPLNVVTGASGTTVAAVTASLASIPGMVPSETQLISRFTDSSAQFTYPGDATSSPVMTVDGNTTANQVQANLNAIPTLGGTLKAGDTTSGNTTILNIASTAGLSVGMSVSGLGIPTGAVITAIPNANSVTISAAPTATATSVALSFNGNVQVTGSTGGPFTVTFTNALANQNVSQIVSSAAGVPVRTVNDGGNAFVVTGNQGGPFTVTFGGGLAYTNVSQLASTSAAVITATTTDGTAPTTAQIQTQPTNGTNNVLTTSDTTGTGDAQSGDTEDFVGKA